MSLGTVIADRDSTVMVELLHSLARVASAKDTSVVLQLLEHAKCKRGFTIGLDSLSRASLATSFARAAETQALDDRSVAALNRVTGECRF